jgi:pyridoxamine 5'-phosphate oxidase
MDQGIADIRKNYSLQSLLERSALPNAIKQFSIWWDEAIKAEIDEVNAMTLATASADGVPAARIVLLKEFSDKGFVFFTNYNSFKGQQLLENPKACLVFFWKELERQVRITGLIQKIDAIDSDAYFFSRPIGSQVGAISSPQSQVIPNREWLDDTYEKNEKKMALQPINRPEHWGGYIVKPVIIEFWQGRPSRLHDRLQYTLKDDGSWKIERLAP